MCIVWRRLGLAPDLDPVRMNNNTDTKLCLFNPHMFNLTILKEVLQAFFLKIIQFAGPYNKMSPCS
jgi:hypothetical protein